MGAIFGKSKSKKHYIITEQDKAILQLKNQRDKIKQYQKRMELKLEQEREIAKKLLEKNQKERALLILKRKKYLENLLVKADQHLTNLEQLASEIEFAQVQVEVAEGLKKGNEALKQINNIMSIEEIESILDETKEGVLKQKEIDELLGQGLTQEDEHNIENELENLLKEKIDNTIPNLPEVPSHKLPEPSIEKVTFQKLDKREISLAT